MTYAIDVDSLTKEYRIASREAGAYRTLRESLATVASNACQGLRRATGLRGSTLYRDQTVVALDRVSVQVKPGEVLGIIGRNGAGKSTLLKVISRVTEPTNGRVTVRGRLASLLEVGTGFHNELTGRENIYLSGAILGMSKRELARKFEAIVDFAEIDGYIDTPVKRYSSGMLVRLAFSVAAHLEPDILLLDEVLAVGDAGFRSKCIRRMKELISSNVAVLFVSHQRSQIAEVCSRCVVLHRGRAIFSGHPDSAWQTYVGCLQDLPAPPAPCSASRARIVSVSITDELGAPTSVVAAHDPLSVAIDYALDKPFRRLGLGVNLHEGNGNMLADCTTFGNGVEIPCWTGKHSVCLELAGLPLAAGNYLIGVRLYDLETGDALDRHYQRYPIMVTGAADQHVISLQQRWAPRSSTAARRAALTRG